MVALWLDVIRSSVHKVRKHDIFWSDQTLPIAKFAAESRHRDLIRTQFPARLERTEPIPELPSYGGISCSEGLHYFC